MPSICKTMGGTHDPIYESEKERCLNSVVITHPNWVMACIVPSLNALSLTGCSLEKHPGERNISTRRSLLIITHTTVFGSAFPSFALSESSVADGTSKVFRNLEQAREEGERRREEKDLAEGPIITLPSGVKFRELGEGSGNMIALGDLCSVYYTIYRLNGLYIDSLGYGKEGKNDVGETFTFQYGSGMVPKAIELGIQGMKVGGKRRILVKPDLGWISSKLLPLPTSSAAERRFNNSKNRPLLFEVELTKVKSV